MATASSKPDIINIVLPPGPLGVGITRARNGYCIVSSKTNASSPLQINDVIVSLNGIQLADVEGGVTAWVKIFRSFGGASRELVVGRAPAKAQEVAATAPSMTTQRCSKAQNQSSSKSNTKATAAPKRKAAAPKEKRLKRFRSNPTIAIQQRIERAVTQRLYLIKTSEPTTCTMHGGPLITFSVLGSTGNVYEVTLSKMPNCSCPDHKKGNLCKHLLFVMLKVVGLPSSSPLVYQSAYLTEELDQIFTLLQNRMRLVGMRGGAGFVANEVVQERFTAMEEKKKTGAGGVSTGDEAEEDGDAVKRKDLNGSECPICFDDLGGSGNITQLTFCRATCGTNFHRDCIRMWTSQHRNNPTCPACRQPWTDATTGGKGSLKKKERGESSNGRNDEGYVNFGELQGQSPVRDTSTYSQSSGYYGGYKRRRRY